MANLLTFLPDHRDLLALEPEDLAGILVELIPGVSQPAGFYIEGFLNQLFPLNRSGGYPPKAKDEVLLRLAEAIAWLEVQGIVMRNPTQPPSSPWLIFTRRGRNLRTRTDLEAYRKGRSLPVELLQPSLAEKVHHLFLRGDHDTAVFQAFKEVELAVRQAGQYSAEYTGRDLMQRAFNVTTGPLRDQTLIAAEREAEMFLFSGAIGHCKNPVSHREVYLSREQAARLIIFASHLLDIVESRIAFAIEQV